MSICKHVSMASLSFAVAFVLVDAALDDPGHNFPPTAFEYAKMVEPILGVPPKIDLGKGVEVPIYVDGVQVHEICDTCDNIGFKGCIPGSVLQRP